MRILLAALFLSLFAAAPLGATDCIDCHGPAALKRPPAGVDRAKLAKLASVTKHDGHAKIACTSCHGAVDYPHPADLAKQTSQCEECHNDIPGSRDYPR